MTDSIDRAPIAELSIGQFHQDVADPAVFLGGGSVASVTAAGAASLAVLVFGLVARRRSNSEVRESLDAAVSEAQAILNQLHLEADHDAQVLDALLLAQRELKGSADRQSYCTALFQAAKTPVTTANHAMRILEIVDAYVDRATRFTVGDLGAAAAFALAAIQASDYMCEINLSLLRSESGFDQCKVDELAAESARLVSVAVSLAAAIDSRTRLMMQAGN